MRGESGDSTLITIFAVFLAAIMMYVIPTLYNSEQSDDISQLAVQTTTQEFVDLIRSKGEITEDELDSYVQKLAATGHTYDIEIEIQILDQNPSKKVTQVATNKIGENIYYSVFYTVDSLLEELQSSENFRKALKEGDIVTVEVKNTDTTIAQQIKSFIMDILGDESAAVYASAAGIVMSNASE